ncbi:GNAT family N-acetyltransferase [Lysobacter alkalisoli]|uniref:GNAT family N-acetyltransferase n=2 Tax=Marilutibacter alkalisoli TaxID=2591633 RepID=A0A514BWL5_9GAMM|nr:GNAT family N-acetyltransferase [Lysobacter alkalisoli]
MVGAVRILDKRIIVEPHKRPRIAPVEIDAEAEALLASAGLPTTDLALSPLRLFGSRRNGVLQGVVGIEGYGSDALLRSLAVAADSRGQGIGRELVEHVESIAQDAGVRRLFLLTTDATAYFNRHGYVETPRGSAPPAVVATAQFASLCPASATLMSKALVLPKDAPSIPADATS